ncbi:MAG: hypothetical protein QXV88_06540, partial [Candidatus Bathyarchaeia archaeon]
DRFMHKTEEKKNSEENRIIKVKVGFFLSKNVIERIRLLIQEKYSEYGRGLLSYEVEMALRHWLALHTKTQNLKETKEAVKPNPTPKAAIIFAEVKNYLLTHYYMELLPGQQIPRKHLEEAIMAVRGTDPRTIEKWLKTFHKMGLIKPITTATWEII